MRSRISLFVIVLVASSASMVSAQNFFWSQADIGGGVVEGDLITSGSGGAAFLYYSPNGIDIIEGLDLDFSWDGGGAAFTAAETFDFHVAIGGTPLGDRWGDFAGPAESVSPGSVEGFLAVNVVAGFGLMAENTGVVFLDEGYDADSGSFQIGRIEWELNGVGASNLQIDSALVVNGVDIGATFNHLCVGGFACGVPEPTSASLLAIALFGMTALRRR